MRYEKDNNTTRQSIPYSSLLSHRLDYIYEDKVHVITLFLKDSIKYTYCFKSCGEAERVYESIRDGYLLQ